MVPMRRSAHTGPTEQVVLPRSAYTGLLPQGVLQVCAHRFVFTQFPLRRSPCRSLTTGWTRFRLPGCCRSLCTSSAALVSLPASCIRPLEQVRAQRSHCTGPLHGSCCAGSNVQVHGCLLQRSRKQVRAQARPPCAGPCAQVPIQVLLHLTYGFLHKAS